MDSPSKTLIIRFSSIGDIVLASPLVRVLRARFPEGEIDLLTRTEYAELLRSDPNLNVTFPYDRSTGFRGLVRLALRLRAERYDLVVDIHNSLRSRLVRWILGAPRTAAIRKRIFARWMLVRLKKNLYRDAVGVADRYIETVLEYGIVNDGQGLALHIPDDVQSRTTRRLATLGLNEYEKVIGLCPSARHETKRWPKERYADLGLRLARRLKAKILLFGGPEDRERCAWIAQAMLQGGAEGSVADLSGELSLLGSATAFTFCDVVITNDSGLMHIAAAMQSTLVAIFGSTVREFGFFPLGTRQVVLERAGLECRPCSHVGRDACPKGHFRCMLDTTVDAVESAAVGLLQKPR